MGRSLLDLRSSPSPASPCWNGTRLAEDVPTSSSRVAIVTTAFFRSQALESGSVSSGGGPCSGRRGRWLSWSHLFGGLRGWDLDVLGFDDVGGFLDNENAPGDIFPVYVEVFDGCPAAGSDVGKPAWVPPDMDGRSFRHVNFYVPVLAPDRQFARLQVDADHLACDMDDFEGFRFRGRRLLRGDLLRRAFPFRLLGTGDTEENQRQQEADEVSALHVTPPGNPVS